MVHILIKLFTTKDDLKKNHMLIHFQNLSTRMVSYNLMTNSYFL